jgi:hypothetical protein
MQKYTAQLLKLLSVLCSVCSPEDAVLSISKHVEKLVKLRTYYFNFVYELVKKYVLLKYYVHRMDNIKVGQIVENSAFVESEVNNNLC